MSTPSQSGDASHKLLRLILEAMPTGIVVVGRSGMIVMVNSRLAELFGYGRFELVGQPIEVLVPERFRAKHVGQRSAFLADPKPRMLGIGRDLFGVRKDGREFPVEIGLDVLDTSAGTLVLGVISDITERKRTEEVLRQAEQHLRRSRDDLELRVEERTRELNAQQQAALELAEDAEEARKRAQRSEEFLNLALNSSGVGIWNTDLKTNLVMWDDRVHALFGLKPGTFAGTHQAGLALVHPDDRDRVQKQREQAIQQDTPYDTEFRVVWPDGSIHIVGLRGKVHRDAAGKPVRMIGVCWDLTQRRQTEEARARLVRELARSNAELEQFAFIASHDLQEPLRKVQSFGDLLVAKAGAKLAPEEQDYVARMQSAAQRMQALIHDLLAFAQVTSKAQPFVPIDLQQVLQGVLSDLETRIKTVGARVEIGKLPQVDSDAHQMRQLFQNLLSNALKFHRPDAPPVVVVQARLVKDHLCEITVRDNGIGFDEKHLDRIFRPFQRLHGRAEFEGTGMGLAICHKIVERHGGTLTAQSTPGQGSAFIVRLPLKQPHS